MRFTITRENLHHGLAAVAATIPTRTTLPVLSNLMLEAEGDGVRVSGTDLDIAVSLKVPAEVDEAASTAKLDNGVLTLTLAKKPPVQPRRITIN